MNMIDGITKGESVLCSDSEALGRQYCVFKQAFQVILNQSNI